MTSGWPSLGPGLNEFGGDWRAYEEHCYSVYDADFHNGPRPWPVPGQVLKIKRNPVLADGRCNTFWHLVTVGPDEAERIPDLSRCERISWPMEILKEFERVYPEPSSQKIVWWINVREGGRRYAIALADFSYVLIVADRSGYVLLWTGYPVEYENQRRKLAREFDAYWKKQGNG